MSKQLIGRRVRITLPQFGVVNQLAKADTGAFHSSMHYVEASEQDGVLSVLIDGAKEAVDFSTYEIAAVKSSNGQVERRYIIETQVAILGEEFTTHFTLTNRSAMKVPILLGRETLRGRFIVDVEYSATAPNPEYKL